MPKVIHSVAVVDLETGKALTLNRDNIAKITTERIEKRDTLVFTTIDGKRYRRAETQDEFEEAWYDAGFLRTDITNVVNLSLGKVLDDSYGVLFFSRNLGPSSIRAHIARLHMSYVKEVMPQYGIVTKKQLEASANDSTKVSRGGDGISLLHDPALGMA